MLCVYKEWQTVLCVVLISLFKVGVPYYYITKFSLLKKDTQHADNREDINQIQYICTIDALLPGTDTSGETNSNVKV